MDSNPQNRKGAREAEDSRLAVRSAVPRDDIAFLVVSLGLAEATAATGAGGRRVELASRPDAPSLARRAVAELSDALHPETIEDLKLLASELVTNSCRHVVGGESISLELELVDDIVRLEVADQGSGFDPVVEGSDLASESGRGLFIVDTLADRWGVHSGAPTRVWAELDVPTRTPARSRPGSP